MVGLVGVFCFEGLDDSEGEVCFLCVFEGSVDVVVGFELDGGEGCCWEFLHEASELFGVKGFDVFVKAEDGISGEGAVGEVVDEVVIDVEEFLVGGLFEEELFGDYLPEEVGLVREEGDEGFNEVFDLFVSCCFAFLVFG